MTGVESKSLMNLVTLRNVIFVFAVIQTDLAGLVFLDRLRRPAGTRRAGDVDRADPADPVHVSGRRPLQIPAARRQSRHRRDLRRHLRLRLHPFLPRVRGDRDLAAGLVHDARLHRRPADVPAGDGAVAAGASGAVLDQRRSRLLHAVGLSQPDRFLLASGHDVVPRGDVVDGRAFHRHLRHLRPARAHIDRGLPVDRRRRQRLRRTARDDRRDADHRRPLAPDGAADGGARLERDRHDLRLRLRQRGGCRHHHHPTDDTLRRTRRLRRCGGDRRFHGRPHHAADDGRRRLPDGAVPRRSVLGRGGARLRARLRLLRLGRNGGLSPVRATVAARCGRGAEGAALRQDQDLDLLLDRAVPALPDGMGRHGRAACRGLYRPG